MNPTIPPPGWLAPASGIQKIRPDPTTGAYFLGPVPPAANAWSAWIQLLAAGVLPANAWLSAVFDRSNLGGAGTQVIEIGYGPVAGPPTSLGQFTFPFGQAAAGIGLQEKCFPPRLIPGSPIIACRLIADVINGAATIALVSFETLDP